MMSEGLARVLTAPCGDAGRGGFLRACESIAIELGKCPASLETPVAAF